MTQKNQDYLRNFHNILDKGINLMTKSFNPVAPITRNRRPTPEEVKLRVLQSQRLNRFIDEMSENEEDRKKKVFEVLQMLSEIAFQRKIFVVRSLGTVINKMLHQIYSSVLINEKSLNYLKSTFGNCQVIYLPSHRSYADFMLMSYVCFCYNLEVPAIAAGMDFHGMMGVGELLRKTGAFFMRRTFGGDDFYWRVFKEYMHEVITYNDFGLEFFVEGTRSRSFKALTPKIGLLSMVLEPYFMGEVHDLKIVPVSVSYEKPLEEQLFVYELLGIPKPKESSMGLFKAISNLKSQNLGRIFFDFDEPISLNEYFGAKSNRFMHASEPAFVQKLTRDEVGLVTDLANEVVRRQQHKIVIMSYNLIALIFSEKTFTGAGKSLTLWEVKKRIVELEELFTGLGAIVAVDTENLDKEIKDTMIVHKNILEIAGNNSTLQLIKPNINLDNVDMSKLKGARLSNEIMNIAVPTFSLQLYSNPTLYWLAQPAFIVLSLLTHGEIDSQILRKDFDNLRKIFIYEFVLYPGFADEDFQQTIASLLALNVIEKTGQDTVKLNKNSNYSHLFLSAVAPFVNCYLKTSHVIFTQFQEKDFTDKDLFIATQSHVEGEILNGKCDTHPYSLCLDSITMVVISLCNLGCLFKQKQLSCSFYLNFLILIFFFLSQKFH